MCIFSIGNAIAKGISESSVTVWIQVKETSIGAFSSLFFPFFLLYTARRELLHFSTFLHTQRDPYVPKICALQCSIWLVELKCAYVFIFIQYFLQQLKEMAWIFNITFSLSLVFQSLTYIYKKNSIKKMRALISLEDVNSLIVS